MFGEPSPLIEGTPAARWRHSGWSVNRRRVFAAMETCQVSQNRRDAFAKCGCNAVLFENDEKPGEFRIGATYCHDRLCVPCANARAAEISRCLQDRIRGKSVSFITLTLCGHGESLAQKLNRLYLAFRSLRSHLRWKETVRGGAAFLEVKWSDIAQRWHPHLHLIADAKYIDQGELSDIWRGLTKDSYIVDIRRVNDHDAVAGYVTKYASKPLNSSFINTPSLLQEALTALRGKRLCFCFGSWYKTPLHEVDFEDEPKGSWTPLYSLDELLPLAERGDPQVLPLFAASNLSHLLRKYLLSDPP